MQQYPVQKRNQMPQNENFNFSQPNPKPVPGLNVNAVPFIPGNQRMAGINPLRKQAGPMPPGQRQQLNAPNQEFQISPLHNSFGTRSAIGPGSNTSVFHEQYPNFHYLHQFSGRLGSSMPFSQMELPDTADALYGNGFTGNPYINLVPISPPIPAAVRRTPNPFRNITNSSHARNGVTPAYYQVPNGPPMGDGPTYTIGQLHNLNPNALERAAHGSKPFEPRGVKKVKVSGRKNTKNVKKSQLNPNAPPFVPSQNKRGKN